MCTVTVITLKDPASRRGRRIRLACNRDEKCTRPTALPPVVREFGGLPALMPVDPVSDGTWISVNSAGLAAVLLNVNPRPSPLTPTGGDEKRGSRGVLIPSAIHCVDVQSALTVLQGVDPREFPPFRLVLVDDRSIGEVRCDEGRVNCEVTDVGDGPRMFTSSGLGDVLVETPRRRLFEETFAGVTDLAEAQDRFHRHRWADRPHLSVCMSRADAQTVSHTLVEIGGLEVSLVYGGGPPTDAAPVHRLSLPRRDIHACPS